MGLFRADTADGEIQLRTGVVDELIVNGVFAMDSSEVSSEHVLADEGGTAGPILVGGLGLGYTTARLLDNGAAELVVAERAAPLVEWARQGVTPQLGRLAEDRRVVLVVADVAEVVPTRRWRAILLDVDNGPGFLIHPDNEALYADTFLSLCHDQLELQGRLLVWCESPSPELRVRLGARFEVEEKLIEVTRGSRTFQYALYLARRT